MAVREISRQDAKTNHPLRLIMLAGTPTFTFARRMRILRVRHGRVLGQGHRETGPIRQGATQAGLRQSLRRSTLVRRGSPAFKGPQGIRRKANVHRGDFGLRGKAPDDLGRKEPVRSEVEGLGP